MHSSAVLHWNAQENRRWFHQAYWFLLAIMNNVSWSKTVSPHHFFLTFFAQNIPDSLTVPHLRRGLEWVQLNYRYFIHILVRLLTDDFFHHNFNSVTICFFSFTFLPSDLHIWHEFCAILPCAELGSDMVVKNGITMKWTHHQISTATFLSVKIFYSTVHYYMHMYICTFI